MQYNIKCETAFFQAVAGNDKTFEIRFNDRGYQKGDTVLLEEVAESHYTGRNILLIITYVSNFNQKENWVVFGFRIIHE